MNSKEKYDLIVKEQGNFIWGIINGCIIITIAVGLILLGLSIAGML